MARRAPDRGLLARIEAIGLFFASAVGLCLPASAEAQTPDWQRVEQVLVAEAASEGFDGMLAVAEVMRARGWALQPFSASRRKDLEAFVARQPQRVRAEAHRAVALARQGSRTVQGAYYYENVAAFGVPRWAQGKRVVATVGRHTFWAKE